MNTCIFILGSFFLQLVDDYDNDFKFVKVESITMVAGKEKYPLIYTSNESIFTGWIAEKDRYMTAKETMDLIKSCNK
jgi:hypothetical protein